MANNYSSFESPEDRCKYSGILTNLLENNNLNWKSFASPKTKEIFIRPNKKEQIQYETLPTISRISIQINGEGKLSFGISGYHHFQLKNTRKKFEERGYDHKLHTDKKGKIGRWWITKRFENLESIAVEFRAIEYLLYEKD